jgi:adenosylcobinamide-phosphate synthase
VNASAVELVAGVAADLAIGDPRWLPHPIRGFGWLAQRLERFWRWTPVAPRAAGLLFWMSAIGSAGAVVWASMIWLPRQWVAIYWIFSLLALRDLDFESAVVIRALRRHDLAEARGLLSRIVGRDTGGLDETEVLRATIETVSENLSDGVIAPLFYLALGGPVAMAVYKAINTLDSMVGYRDERYRDFGWASARVDDVANFVPARLTALLVCGCALLLGLDARGALRTTVRDARSQPSPNAGYPEAAFAGALGVRLGGLNFYRGVASRKPYLGDALRPLDFAAYGGSRRLLYGSAALMVLLSVGFLR